MKDLESLYRTWNGDFTKIAIELQRKEGACKTKWREIHNDKDDKEKILSKQLNNLDKKIYN